MTVLPQLASALNRRDEVPNQELAAEIAKSKNQTAVRELVENLTNRNAAIRSDCIKVLYEVGERSPKLIARYAEEFGELLASKQQRLVWGAMMALDTIAAVEPARVHGLLNMILTAAGGESVIARDHAVGILIKLTSQPNYANRCWPLLLDQLKTCPPNQLPMYAEQSMILIDAKRAKPFAAILESRLPVLPKASQQARLQKVLRKLEKNNVQR